MAKLEPPKAATAIIERLPVQWKAVGSTLGVLVFLVLFLLFLLAIGAFSERKSR